MVLELSNIEKDFPKTRVWDLNSSQFSIKFTLSRVRYWLSVIEKVLLLKSIVEFIIDKFNRKVVTVEISNKFLNLYMYGQYYSMFISSWVVCVLCLDIFYKEAQSVS